MATSATAQINLFNGPGCELGSAPVPQNWKADHIVYYKLMLDSSTPGNGPFKFDGSSGRAFGVPIQTFLSRVQDGDPRIDEIHALSDREVAPHIRAIQPCYVVLELDDTMDWYFMPGAPAIKTGTDCSTQYVEFRHILEDDPNVDYPVPKQLPGKIGQDPGAGKSRIIYFAVLDPSVKHDDPANFYTQIGNGAGGAIPLVLDPDIKNDGGDPE